MATSSGIVLDFDSNLGVSGAQVYLLPATGTNIFNIATCSPIGTFEITTPPTASGDLLYFPVKSNMIGYGRVLPKELTFVNLYLRSSSSPSPDASVRGQFNALNSMLVTSPNVREMVATKTHFYAITDAGLDVVDANTYLNVGYIKRVGGFSAISLNPEFSTSSGVLLGTTNSGVFEFFIPETYSHVNRNLASLLIPKYNIGLNNISDNHVFKIHQNSTGQYFVGTASGVNLYTTSGFRWSTLYGGISGTTACFISEAGDVYYSPTNSGLHVKYGPINSNWSLPDYTILLSGTGANPFPLLSNHINDIEVVSVSGDYNNTVYLATRSGLVGYTEDADLNVSAVGATLLRSLP